MKLNERRTRGLKRELRTYVNSTHDSVGRLQKKVDEVASEQVKIKSRLSSIERRFDRRDRSKG